MLLKIDFQAEVPIYEQLKNEIIKGVAKGELIDGEGLPSVRQMAEDIGINMHTVNKAYNQLKDEGFITIDRRRGAFINSKNIKRSIEYDEKLKEQMSYVIAGAYLRGIKKEEFIDFCKNIFDGFENRG